MSLLESSDAATSPGLRAVARGGQAFELKFELTQADVPRLLDWARRHLRPDPHGEEGCYRVTSVYCDTPELDVFHRSVGYRGGKLRMRRYDEAPFVFLERKVKKGDQVRKRRVEVAPDDLRRLAAGTSPQAAAWFLERALKKGVAPTARVGYRRTAFYGPAVRVTMDENLIGVPARGWEVEPLRDGRELLPGGALLELKFHDAMPDLFRRLLPELPLKTARVSKYRRCVALCGLVR